MIKYWNDKETKILNVEKSIDLTINLSINQVTTFQGGILLHFQTSLGLPHLAYMLIKLIPHMFFGLLQVQQHPTPDLLLDLIFFINFLLPFYSWFLVLQKI
jgi:hypothetical protein